LVEGSDETVIIPPSMPPPLPQSSVQSQPNVVQTAIVATMQAASQTTAPTRTQMKSAAAPVGRDERAQGTPDRDRTDERMSTEARVMRQKRRGGALDLTL
jgi:hypothetical protein